jgi:hypothetical protein
LSSNLNPVLTDKQTVLPPNHGGDVFIGKRFANLALPGCAAHVAGIGSPVVGDK